VIDVAGNPNKAIDHGGKYRKACNSLAADLGWQPSQLFNWWREFVMMREFEQSCPRSVAEWLAMRDLRACIAKQGAEPD
jgi:transposase-like protein